MDMHKLGCRRDKKDNRDYLMRAYLPAVKLPMRVDYTGKMTAIRDQGDEGTCVGFASVAGMKEYQERVDYAKIIDLSPRFVYSECKKIDGAPDSEGTSIRVAMKVLKKKGVCREKFWPYMPLQKNRAKKGAKEDAAKFRQLTYARILDLDELRMSLSAKGPCVIGVMVFSGMMNTLSGVVPMPATGERPLGGHAICPVGYDDRKELVKFKNSWSADWGDGGYGFLPYKYINDYMMDAWSSVDIDDPNPLTIAAVARYLD
ncbi:hypothetical protein COY52_07670 [Candidatus Desantisbacteria bacterium CG_4_10_14_0_8_um_filter_48_22]|uniref:Peptidase C1A papain C-terminal domain-containing protein n=1 Tax=Candidatus Desantisbacteria bacterium CG_4_10_14_0_8_um_filter_48_22 TaxID=1974543 RepID=A0A2M7S9N2_9BACT|nr:MAG: hypothetical protein COS16_02405 [Candidatus Desantisbacteria bacterium CG02_land_8_20_14_3_00_49_13]PIZ16237.1 MAG: hypothetical protein COY52_07670 [Candidatus Desantisbacteria bacterium CG_4_10_14_0_8_um_filter_48_22]